jgi:hypothetical protein
MLDLAHLLQQCAERQVVTARRERELGVGELLQYPVAQLV